MSPETEPKPKTVHVSSGSMAGAFWTAGWMFTIAFAKLIWWKALLAFVIWPWYLALAVR
jgi:acyl-coenzyme A synthetase/AMP-(fatty) acid ligase